MCCARTAALQGGYEKQKRKASRDFWQQPLHHVLKSFKSYAKNAFCSCVRHVPKFIKHSKNYGFVAWRAFLWCVLANAKNPWRIRFWRLQNLPPTIQNRGRSDPKPEKNDQHEPKKCKKRSRTSQERKKTLKSEKCANIRPTWPQQEEFRPIFWMVCPPPSKEKQYVNASIKCSGI